MRISFSLEVSWEYSFFDLSSHTLVVGLVFGPLVLLHFPYFLKLDPFLLLSSPYVFGIFGPHLGFMQAHIGHLRQLLDLGW